MTYPSKPLIIGVSGKKRSGKDTLYQTVRDNFPELRVARRAFADRVKEFAYKYFKVDADSDKESYRVVLQGIGEMMREEVKDTFWIHAATEEWFDGEDVIFFTDCRYQNELDYAKRLDGVTVRVEGLDPGQDRHPSEVALDGATFDYYLENKGSLEEYEKTVIEWFENLWRNHNGI